MTDEELARARAEAVGRLLRRFGSCEGCGAGNEALYLDPHHRPGDLDRLEVPIGVDDDEGIMGVVRCAACSACNGFVGDTGPLKGREP